jgi:3-methyladenine DNA glycosylase AlkD
LAVVDAAGVAAGIEDELRAVAVPARAEGEKAYLKSDLDFLGVTVAQVRTAVRRVAPSLDRAGLLAVVDELWTGPLFDRRLAAALLLGARADLLEPADLALLERLIRASSTWALVDVLAGDVAGALLLRHPEAADGLDRWAVDDDFWVRRSSLLALRRPMEGGLPLDRFLGYADAMLDEKEFFVRKAIGWVLREQGKRRPDEVVAWLTPRTHRASGVTMREAVKYLPPEDRDELMAAYRDRP